MDTRTRWACAVTAGAMALIILLYAGLIGIGHWQGDEFTYVVVYREKGLLALLQERVLGWSPRPLSEPLLALYAATVDWARQPLIAPFLALLWGLLLLAAFVTLKRGSYGTGLPYRLVLGLALPAMFLAGNDLNELFYWPMAATGYIPTVAALLAAFFIMLDRPESRIAATLALIAAAWCSEVGAVFVLCLSVARLPALFRRRCGGFAFALPLLAAAAVLLVLLSDRAGSAELPTPGALFLHRPIASLIAAAPTLLQEFGSLNGGPVTRDGFVAAFFVHALFFAGCRHCWLASGKAGTERHAALAFAIGALLAAYASIAMAYYHFGFLCCMRHAAFRQCLITLALAGFAVASAPWRIGDAARLPRWAAPLPLLVAALIAFDSSLGALLHDYRLYPAVLATRERNWQAGLRTDSTAMVYQKAPLGLLLRGESLPEGVYRLDDNPGWWARDIMRFFGKREVDIRPAS